MRVVRGGLALILVAAGAVTGASAAGAAPNAVTGAANLGSVVGSYDGDPPVDTGPLARCTVTGTRHAHLDGRTVGTAVDFGAGDSTCTRTGSTVITRAAGGSAAVNSIRDFSGVGMVLHDYAARCTAGANSATARIAVGSAEFGGRVSLPDGARTLPNPVPKNYTASVAPYLPPGPSEGIVFNEQVPNGRGGVTVSVAHYKPYGGGDVYIGRADCAPTG